MTSSRDPSGRMDPQGRLWLADTLWRIGAIQFGDFSLGRTVRNSPVYVNAKLLISRPDVLKRTARLIQDELELEMLKRQRTVDPFDAIAGVPIGGLHVATALALQMEKPLLYIRPPKDSEETTTPQIEGIYRPGQRVIVVDDLAAGGGSLVTTAKGLRNAGLVVTDTVVLMDREQGAARRLEAAGVRMHSLLSLAVVLTYLDSSKLLREGDFDRAMAYLRREGEPRSEFD